MTDEVPNKKWDMLKWHSVEQQVRDVTMNWLLAKACRQLDEEQLKAIAYQYDGTEWNLFPWYSGWLDELIVNFREEVIEKNLEILRAEDELLRLKLLKTTVITSQE